MASTEEGVSAYPAEVTGQMLVNFMNGGAAINVLARQAGARVLVVDMGDSRERIRAARRCIRHVDWPRDRQHGARAGDVAPAGDCGHRSGPVRRRRIGRVAGVGLIGVGEMGIGNTTAASALTAVFTGAPVAQVTGRGTGIDDATWKHKIAVIERALAVNQPSRDQPLDALAKVGGFEIAGLVGLMLGAAERRIPVVLDGFITGAAALVAVALCPAVRDYLIASHQSVEPGHRRILEHLELRPLLQSRLAARRRDRGGAGDAPRRSGLAHRRRDGDLHFRRRHQRRAA